ncbi:MAG: adenylate/guanylate cyclase domain-containing protein [Oligoflexales bacterium]
MNQRKESELVSIGSKLHDLMLYLKRVTAPPVHGVSVSSIERLLDDEKKKSDIIINFIQMGLIAFLGLLWVIAPTAQNRKVDSVQVMPWIIASYLLFLAFKQYWCRRGHAGERLQILTTVIETGGLLAFIWFLHVQYGEPAGFSLRVPTYAYLFVFVCLQAIRFEARPILIAGSVAAIGWMALTIAVIASGEVAITRSFSDYVDSGTVLVGAEVEKVLLFGVVSGILAVAAVRARSLMLRVTDELRKSRDLSRFFSPDVAKIITAGESELKPGTGVLRTAAVLMIDIRGYTKLSTLIPPDEVIAMLSEYQQRVTPVVFANGGSIDKFIGDGVLAHFGATQVSPTYAADCLRSSILIVEAIEKWNHELMRRDLPRIEVNLACAIGPVVFGTVGDIGRLEFTIIGEAVNLSAKLEGHNKTIGTTAVTTVKTLETARLQGFSGGESWQIRKSDSVLGLPHKIDVVIIDDGGGTQ